MPSVTFTVTAAEAQRVSKAAQAAGYPADGKAWVIALVQQNLRQYEQITDTQQFHDDYVPVQPT